jgi:menaquinone-9 beta-reductase
VPGSRTADVVVVGAGPAGSAAAITLARLGRRVTLVDKATFPRDKCCGDGLTTAALRLLAGLGLDPSNVKSWEPVTEAHVVSTHGYEVRLPLPKDGTQFGASAKRADLDAALFELASREGAETIDGNAVTAVEGIHGPTRHAGVSVQLESGDTINAQYVIASDGMWSPVRKLIGEGDSGYLGEWQAGRIYYENVGPDANKLWVWFEPDMIPGYAWSFPLPGGAANVGYGVIRRPGESLGELKGQRIDFTERPHIAAVLGPDARPAGSWKAWPIPARIGETRVTGLDGRILFAGDAARACDPMTGEGIAQAIETAENAAKAICEAGPDRPHAAARRYERQIRWGIALDNRLAGDLSGLLAHRRGSTWALQFVDRSDWCRRNFARWMFEDYPRAALITPHRWRRRMFSETGAYQLT